jgi:hypothetical protein
MSGRRYFSRVSQRTSWQPSLVRSTLEQTLIPIAPISYSLSLLSMHSIRRPVDQRRLIAVEIIILQGSTLRCMTIQSIAYRDANRAPPPVSAHLQKISCQGYQSDTPAVQDEPNHLVSAKYVAATEPELAQTRKRLLPAWGSPEPLNQGRPAARVVSGGDHSIVWCKC